MSSHIYIYVDIYKVDKIIVWFHFLIQYLPLITFFYLEVKVSQFITYALILMADGKQGRFPLIDFIQQILWAVFEMSCHKVSEGLLFQSTGSVQSLAVCCVLGKALYQHRICQLS